MDVAELFVFQQAIPINIQKKFKADQLDKGKGEGESNGGIGKHGLL